MREGAIGDNLHKIQTNFAMLTLLILCSTLQSSDPCIDQWGSCTKNTEIKKKQPTCKLTIPACLCYTLYQHCLQTLCSVYPDFSCFSVAVFHVTTISSRHTSEKLIRSVLKWEKKNNVYFEDLNRFRLLTSIVKAAVPGPCLDLWSNWQLHW